MFIQTYLPHADNQTKLMFRASLEAVRKQNEQITLILRDKIESRIVNTPGAESIDVNGRFFMNSDKLYDLQFPYLELEDAKKLLKPFNIMKQPVKDVTEESD